MKNFKSAVLLAENAQDIFHAKTALAILRYKTDSIHSIIDSSRAGKTAGETIGVGGNTPIFSNVEEAVSKTGKTPDALIPCLMLPKGKIPELWLKTIIYALNNNIDIINPLHLDLGQINEIAETMGGLAKESNSRMTMFNNSDARIFNIRIPEAMFDLFTLEVRETKAKRVLTVGSDCNVGKMVTSLEMNKLAQSRGINCSFIATGQIGILINGWGTAIDRVISDFVPAEVEKIVLREKNKDILFIEGQGSLFQPLYSAVSMGLVHGCAPHAMIFCHVPSREHYRYTDIKIKPLNEMIDYYNITSQMITPDSNVKGIALNCFNMSDTEALNVIKKVESETGLPTDDPIKFGAQKLLDTIL